jgi:succinoglycan biosynthesis transport protein ExoP
MQTRLQDPSKQWASLWAAKWLILIAAILVGVATYFYYDRQPRVYLANTTLLIGSSQVEEILREGGMPQGDDRALNNQAALLNSQQFAGRVRGRLQERRTAVGPFGISATASAEADLLAIEAQANSARDAATVANAYAAEYIERRREQIRRAYEVAIEAMKRQADRTPGTRERRELLDRVGSLQTLASVADPDAQQVDVAQPPPTAVTPRPGRNAVFGFVLGLVLAGGIVYLRSRLDRRLRSLVEVEQVFRRPVLAAIPPLRRGRRPSGGEPAADMREPLRRLLTTLELERSLDRSANTTRKILVTSAHKGEGKSIVVSNLALVAREAGLRVAVVDTDLLAPGQAQLLGVQTVPGLSDVLAGRVELDDAWQRVADQAFQPAAVRNGDAPLADTLVKAGEIQVLASGTRTPNPSAPVASPAIGSVLASRDGDLDYVFVDAPPPLAVSDALPLLSSVDGIVVVARLGHANQTGAERLAELLEHRTAADIVGVVANGVPEEESASFGFVSVDRYAR